MYKYGTSAIAPMPPTISSTSIVFRRSRGRKKNQSNPKQLTHAAAAVQRYKYEKMSTINTAPAANAASRERRFSSLASACQTNALNTKYRGNAAAGSYLLRNGKTG